MRDTMSVSTPAGPGSAPGTVPRSVALVSSDPVFTESLRGWIDAEEPALDLVLAVSTWGEMLHDARFPTALVVLDAASSRRNSIQSRVRTLRSTGAAVIVMVAPREEDAAGTDQRARAAGAFCVLEKSVPPALVCEMARGALGLPIGHPEP
jgi:DNA-binding NarL/FixJ family response regulator